MCAPVLPPGPLPCTELTRRNEAAGDREGQVMTHNAKEPDLRRSSFTDSRSGLLPATQRALLHRIAKGQADGRLPSLAAGVMRDGAQAWFAARGTVDGAAPTADTQYRIGSMTKMFVALTVMRLPARWSADAGRPSRRAGIA